MLYDQYNDQASTDVTSQDFETAYDQYDSQAADDFVVPTGQTWQISEVDVDGEYVGNGPATAFNVYFYLNSGTLPGTPVYTATNQSFTGSSGDAAVTLAVPAALSGGTYWVSVQARENSQMAGQWFWHNRMAQANSASAWRNAGHGYGSSCTDWGVKTTCLSSQTGPDQVFRLVATIVGANTPTPTPTCLTAPVVFTGSLAAGDPTLTARLDRNGVQSTCSTPKTCPSSFPGTYLYDTYTVTNNAGSPQCVNISLTTATCNVQLSEYLGSFDPSNLCTNYLGDPGLSTGAGGTVSNTVTLPPGAVMVIVVNDPNGTTGCGSYTVEVDGLCAAGTPTPTPSPTATPEPCLLQNYSVSTGTATVVPASTFLPGSNCDDCVVPIALPFAFQLYDRTFTSVTASSNGNLQFLSNSTDFTNACLPHTNFNYAIMPHWDDLLLTGTGQGIYTLVEGTAPNRVFDIEWRGTYFSGAGAVDFEVRLFEGGPSRFDVVYGTVSQGGSSATVGVQRDTGSRFTQYECNTAGTLTAGLTLHFVGPTCNTPTPTSTSTPTPCPINFTDVHPTDYFYNDVRCVYCLGAVSGYSDGTFRPYANTTRGQMTKIIVLALRIPIYTPTAGSTFSDVPRGSTFFDYVETAAHNNIVSGYTDGTFRPNTLVTRGQLSKIDATAANHVFGWPLLNPSTPTFSDVPRTNPFYTYIETAACHGVISGYSDGTFKWGNNAIRAQIAKIVCHTSQNPPAQCASTPSP